MDYNKVREHIQRVQAQIAPNDSIERFTQLGVDENDRAQTECQTEGKIQVITKPNGVVVGCDIVGAHAGELLLPWVRLCNIKCILARLLLCCTLPNIERNQQARGWQLLHTKPVFKK